MKIGILTYHQAENYGAILQAYALQQTIINFGLDCDIIDYNCEGILKQFKFNLKNSFFYKKKIKFSNFRKKYLKLSSPFFLNNIFLTNAIYDNFIVGSDQVWNFNCNNNDTTYLLDFVKDLNKKNSYAASFGKNTLPNFPESYLRDKFINFNFITVREQNGANLLKKLINKKIPVVLDPVFLLTKENWQKFVNTNNKKYILVYQLYYTESLLEFAKNLSKKENLRLIIITISLKTKFFSFFNAIDKSNVGPKEFISLIGNAEYIVTNSFHGTALSIILNKQFFTEYVSDLYNVNSRFDELFQNFDLYGRKINKDLSYKPIDYKKINDILDNKRIKAIKYLKRMLNINYE
jgi:Polysaccharide pyruvyl transferase.